MMKLEVGPVPMDGLIDGVIASLRPLAESRGLRLDSDLHDPDLVGLCDADRTRQVLTNLVANAIKFTNEGAVSVRAGVERGQAMVSVFDTGIGIPEEALDLIFEKFAQADGSTTRRFGGTGLGLSISRKLVELQGGQMGVESTVGVGSRFWFTLPLAPAAPDDIPERALNDAIVI